MSKLILLATFHFLYSLCSAFPQQPLEIPVIDIEANISSFDTVDLSLIAADVTYIPLESNVESLFEGMRDLLVTDDRIIVSGTDFIRIFDRQGNYLAKAEMDNESVKPGDRLFLSEMTYDPENERIYFDTRARLMYEFSADAEYRRTIDLLTEMPLNTGYYIGNGIFCANVFRGMFNPECTYELVLFNEDGELVKGFPNKSAGLGSAPSTRLWVGESVFYSDNMNDTLYKLTSDLNLQPGYYINLGKYKIPAGTYRPETVNNAILMEINDKEYEYLRIDDYITETDKYLLFTCYFADHLPASERWSDTTFIYPNAIPLSPDSLMNERTLLFVNTNRTAPGFYNKSTDKLVFLNSQQRYPGFQNDMDGGMPFWPGKNEPYWHGAQAYKEQLFRAFTVTELKAWIETEIFKNSTPLYPEKKKAFEEMVRNLDLLANPVLMLVTLKE